MVSSFATFVVIGSGVAASSFVEEILSLISLEKTVLMISLCPNIKVASALGHLGRTIQKISVNETMPSCFNQSNLNFSYLCDIVVSIDDIANSVITKSGKIIKYQNLIICTGSIPKKLYSFHHRIHTLRDTDSVQTFKSALEKSSTVCVIGNGGIAMEIVFEISGCIVHWIVKHNYIGKKFFDEQTAEFFKDLRNSRMNVRKSKSHVFVKQDFSNYRETDTVLEGIGSSVGPDWNRNLELQGNNPNCPEYPENIKIYLNSGVKSIHECGDVVKVETIEGIIIECDLVIVAIGAEPNSEITKTTTNKIELNEEGAIIVNDKMCTSIPNIYAAGDCVEVRLNSNINLLKWFQIKLWHQAKFMGAYAARCLALPNPELPIEFEIFTHLTYFFGFKVCLLGLYNKQGIEDLNTVSYYRCDEHEFVRVTLYDGKIIGAVLIGETGMEDTIENLILSEIDVSSFGEDIISPDIDICDYFE